MILERPWVLPLENVLDIIQRGVDSTLLAVGHHAVHDSRRCDRLSRVPCSALSHTTSLVTRTSASPDRSHRHKEERYRSSDRSWTSLDLLSTALIPGPHLYRPQAEPIVRREAVGSVRAYTDCDAGDRRTHRQYSESGVMRNMTSELSGVTALVTGGTSGIGRAAAVALVRLGAHVAVSGRDEQRGDQVVKEIVAAGGRAEFLAAELRDAASARWLADRAVERLGQVDVLVNNAGIYPFGPTEQMTEADFDAVFGLNVKVPYFLVARLAPDMAKRGRGAIINVSTMAAEFGAAGMTLYGASKAALVLLTKSWAAEYGPHGVRVNAVSPGPIRTEGTAGMGDDLDQLAAAAPAGRPGTVEEVAEVIAFLATGRASFVHGAVVPVDGGRIAV